MQVSTLYSFKMGCSTLCRGTVCFLARQAPAACQSSTSSLLVARRKQNSIFISPSIQQEPLSCLKIENACFSVWCMDVCVPSGTPVSNFLTWKHLPSKEAEKQFLSDSLCTGPSFPLPSWFHRRNIIGCRARIVWDVQLILCWVLSPLVVVISSIRNLLEKSLCWGKNLS